MIAALLYAALLAALAAPADTTAPPDPVAELRADAATLRPLARTPLGRAFLAATADLPRTTARTVWRDSSRTHWWTDAQARALPDTTRARLVSRELDESFYWNTRYGSPLAYLRALDILGANGLRDVKGKRIVDFGCGGLGPMRLLASLGADAIGVDVDPLLPVLYSEPGDRGAVAGGRLSLATGQWPGDAAVAASVGSSVDVFLSKNTLKNGYLHPAETVDPRMLVHLGVPDSAFLAALARVVRPGGVVLIYNLCPAPAAPGKPYIPWADGRCPFPREDWERAGFKVVAFDRDDGLAARAMGHALGWDQGQAAMDLEHDLFATWSLFVRRR